MVAYPYPKAETVYLKVTMVDSFSLDVHLYNDTDDDNECRVILLNLWNIN